METKEKERKLTATQSMVMLVFEKALIQGATILLIILVGFSFGAQLPTWEKLLYIATAVIAIATLRAYRRSYWSAGVSQYESEYNDPNSDDEE